MMKKFVLLAVAALILGGCAPMRPTLSVSAEIHVRDFHVCEKPPVIKLEYKLEPETRRTDPSRGR